jgi:hypothetical protein
MTKGILPLGAALALLWACDGSHHGPCSKVTGTGSVVTESRAVHGFSAVELNGAAHLIVEQTGVESLSVTAEDNILPLVRSEVRNGRLVLGFESQVGLSITREVLFRLTVRELTKVEASGASQVEIRDVDSAELTLRISGASSVSAQGTVERARVSLAGASHCAAPDLRTKELTADLSGASYALVRASDALDASVSGASVLEYFGDPRLTTNVTGSSLVRRVGP